MNKAELRAQMRAMRRMLSADEQRMAAQAVFAQLASFAPYRRARRVMAYMASRGELSLEYAIRDVLHSGKTLLLPRCDAPGEMTARRIAGEDDLVKGMYGLLEPASFCEIIAPQEIDLILVPGVAFDRAGGRLGQGGGYYDRFLSKSGALRVGVCHGFALLDAVPLEAHDEQMDYVITPGGMIPMGRDTTGGCTHG